MSDKTNGRNGQFPELVADIGSAGQLQTTAAPISPIGQKVTAALRESLAWRPRSIDPKGFVAALNSSFEITQKDGHTEWKWTPRSYAVQADMGAVTGAQASIWSRAKAALDHAKPLVEGLKSLNPATDEDEAESIRSIVISGMERLVDELGTVGGWRSPRVAGLFATLLGPIESNNAQDVAGLFGRLREQLKVTPEQVNSVDEEQNLTNFLIVVDHFVSLRNSWINLPSDVTGSSDGDFFGTQLVQLSRRLGVIVETVQQIYRIMDAVLIGAEDRQAIKLYLILSKSRKETEHALMPDTSLTIAELLSWTERFAQEEAPEIIEEAGKEGVISFRATMSTLTALVTEMTALAEKSDEQLSDIDRLLGMPQDDVWDVLQKYNQRLPENFYHIGVGRSLSELVSHLSEAKDLVDSFWRIPSPVVISFDPAEINFVDPTVGYDISVIGKFFEEPIRVILQPTERTRFLADQPIVPVRNRLRTLSVGRLSAINRWSATVSSTISSPEPSSTDRELIWSMDEVVISPVQLTARFSIPKDANGLYEVVVVNATTGARSEPSQAMLTIINPQMGTSSPIAVPSHIPPSQPPSALVAPTVPSSDLHTFVPTTSAMSDELQIQQKKPSITSATYSVLDDDEYAITIIGDNFAPSAEVQIILRDGDKHTTYTVPRDDMEVSTDGKTIDIVVLLQDKTSDIWKVRVDNLNGKASRRFVLTRQSE